VEKKMHETHLINTSAAGRERRQVQIVNLTRKTCTQLSKSHNIFPPITSSICLEILNFKSFQIKMNDRIKITLRTLVDILKTF
jgi:hypothetical protein